MKMFARRLGSATSAQLQCMCRVSLRHVPVLMDLVLLRATSTLHAFSAALQESRKEHTERGSMSSATAATSVAAKIDASGTSASIPEVGDDSVGDDSGGWYSPRAIEARVRIPRRRPAGSLTTQRQRPGPSEEDFYSSAGAPGYTEDRSIGDSSGAASGAPFQTAQPPTAATQPQPARDVVMDSLEEGTAHSTSHQSFPTVAAAAAEGGQNERIALRAQSGSAASSPPTPTPVTSIDPATFELFAADPRAFPLVRLSKARVLKSQLPAFIRSFQLRAVPAYRALPGCSGVQLWVGGVPPAASPAEICTAALVGKSAGPLAIVAAKRRRSEGGGASRSPRSDLLGADGSAEADDDGAVPVTAVYVWNDAAALDSALAPSDADAAPASAAAAAYAAAMESLRPYFRERPTSQLVRRAA